MSLFIGLATLPAKAQIDCVNIGTACRGTSICDDADAPPDTCCLLVPGCCTTSCSSDPCCAAGALCGPCEGPCEGDPDDTTFPCGGTPIAALTDLSAGSYSANGTTLPRGLYTNTGSATNTIPTSHKTAGMNRGDMIVPRSTSGVVDHVNGFIGVLSIGFSNPNQEFGTFLENKIEPLTGTLDGLNNRLVFINGADPTKDLCEWEDTPVLGQDNNTWGNIVDTDGSISDDLVTTRAPGSSSSVTGLFAAQVQVVWMKGLIQGGATQCQITSCGSVCPTGLCGSLCDFPDWNFNATSGEATKFITVLEHIRDVFPNVRHVYLSSRTYGGFGNETDVAGGDPLPDPCSAGSLEPWAFENGFSIRKLIQEQLNGNLPFGPADPYSWIGWGPYIWSNGDQPTAALPYETTLGNLTWTCEKSCADGQHPSRDEDVSGSQISGQADVANRLYAFFHNTDITQEWFLEKPVIISSTPNNGWIDRRQDRDAATGTTPQGLTQITIFFDKDVFDGTTGSVMSAASFSVQVTGGTAPSITSMTAVSNSQVVLNLSGPIPPGQWTTIIANVKDANGNMIRRDPWDRLDFEFLPADADASGTSNDADVTHIEEQLANPPSSPDLVKLDQDRSGTFTSADRTRCVRLLDGYHTTQAWRGVVLPARP